MKKRTATLSLALIFISGAAMSAPLPDEFKTKIAIKAATMEAYESDAPAYIVYPDGEALEVLKESGAISKLEQSLEAMGYTLVDDTKDAAVYIRVGFTEYEPFTTEVGFKSRPTLDYSNSAASVNYASVLFGGRYDMLANTQKNRASNDATAILGPSGEIIVLGDQEERAPKLNESGKQIIEATVYPISLEVSAWRVEIEGGSKVPHPLWATVATYHNLRDEEAPPQLYDLSQVSTQYLGKNLKKEKFVSR